MAFNKFTSLDFDQIKDSIKDYLRANSDFSGFDFEGSNFSVLIDALAYSAYTNAVNANMIVNESFLDSAVLRKNVVSLAGNIGYLPRSVTAAQAKIYTTLSTRATTPTLSLQAGLVCIGANEGSNYVFSIPEPITVPVDADGNAQFGTEEDPIVIYQGTFIKKKFTVDASLDQRFILNNSGIDYSTLVVRVANGGDSGEGDVWSRVDNVVEVGRDTEAYIIKEIEGEKYELIFGDDIFAKALKQGQEITATYIVTDGEEGNGPRNFLYAGSVNTNLGVKVTPTNIITVNTVQAASNGSAIERVDSIKYYAPRSYGAQYRAVTGRDYEAIIKNVYPNTESVSVVGGEELDPPQFGNVLISIKPVNGTEVSEFDKRNILESLKKFTIAGINQKIVDLKILFVEIESYVYYNINQVASGDATKTKVLTALNDYSSSVDLNKFGGRFKYSKTQRIIDESDTAITSNITRVIMRRNLNCAIDQFAQYELCYGNAFKYENKDGNIKSTGFTVFGLSAILYLRDYPRRDANGNLDGSGLGKISIISVNTDSVEQEFTVVVEDAGEIDYNKGEIKLNTVRITGTQRPNRIVEIQAYPLSNDVIGLKDLYVSFDVSNSKINMIKDTIASGEQISGVGFPVYSSYGNGPITR